MNETASWTSIIVAMAIAFAIAIWAGVSADARVKEACIQKTGNPECSK